MSQKRGASDRGAEDAKRRRAGEDEEEKALNHLNVLHTKLTDMQNEMAAEMAKVQHRFNIRMRPLFTEREKSIEKIPNFWINGHPLLSSLVQEQEVPLLETLRKVDVKAVEDRPGVFTIELTFGSNPHLKSNKLWRTVDLTSGDVSHPATSCSGVAFKPGKEIALHDEDGEAGLLAFFAEDEPDASVAEAFFAELFPSAFAFAMGQGMGDDSEDGDEEGDEEEEEEEEDE